jgi:CrcB protein
MTVPVVLAIGLVGGAGAIARFLLDGVVAARLGRGFPYGTLTVNLIGAFGLGVILGAAVGGDTYRLFGTALIGSFTTFSTWMLESHRLGEEGDLSAGLLNLGVSLALGLLVTWLGQQLGSTL